MLSGLTIEEIKVEANLPSRQEMFARLFDLIRIKKKNVSKAAIIVAKEIAEIWKK